MCKCATQWTNALRWCKYDFFTPFHLMEHILFSQFLLVTLIYLVFSKTENTWIYKIWLNLSRIELLIFLFLLHFVFFVLFLFSQRDMNLKLLQDMLIYFCYEFTIHQDWNIEASNKIPDACFFHSGTFVIRFIFLLNT